MLNCAISPCPNDTYLFYAWMKKIVGRNCPIKLRFADIDQLNNWALKKKFSLIKVSFNCFAKIIHNYQLLPVGSALGFNCGPKIISKKYFSISEFSKKKIAIPGRETTAHLLLERLGLFPKEKIFCLYHEILSRIINEEVDCGLIIHESRFTFDKAGLSEIADLGKLWQTKKHFPLPLGGIAIAREIPDATKRYIVDTLQRSLIFAHNYPEKALPFILNNSQEKDVQIVQKHISTYVNKETFQLSQVGINAIKTLLELDFWENWLFL